MSDFHFLYPWHLLGLLLCVALWFVVRHARSTWYQIMDKPVAEALIVGRAKPLLQLLPLLCALGVLGLAGPSWQKQLPAALSPQSSVMVIFQQDLAMYAQDLTPSRHQRMQHKIMSLVSRSPGTGFGLIVYDSSAYLTTPLTQDPDFFSLFLEAQSPTLMPQGEGSALRQAIALAQKNLPDTQQGVNSLLLVADTMSAEDADLLSQLNIPVQIWAVGTKRGGTMPAAYAERGIDTRLDVERFMALRDAGILVTLASADDGDLAAISGNIAHAVQAQSNARQDLKWADGGYWLVIPILGLLLFGRRQLFLAVLVALPLGLYSGHSEAAWLNWWLTGDQQGQLAFDRHEYAEAAQQFEDPLRRGIASYFAEDYAAALTAFRQAQATPESLLWLGNSYAQQKSWQAALDSYDQALSLRPEWEMAQDNRAKIANIIMQLRKKERDREASQEEQEGIDPDEIKHDLKKGEGVNQQDIQPGGSANPQLEQWYDNVQLSPAGLLRNLYQADAQEGQ